MSSEKEIVQFVSRFSNRAENYMRYRPSYPREIISFFERTLGLNKFHCIADIGSGTGLFSELFLKQGYSVIGIEPDVDMRNVAEKKLSNYPRLRSQAGSSEQTGLAAASVDMVTIAKAFQWMDVAATKQELDRILKPGGKIIVSQTTRKLNSDLQVGYEKIKKGFTLESRPEVSAESIQSLFSPHKMYVQQFYHSNWLDFDSLKGLLLSSPGIPLPGHSSYDTMISSLVQLFVACNHNGFVLLEYETSIYYNKPGLLI